MQLPASRVEPVKRSTIGTAAHVGALAITSSTSFFATSLGNDDHSSSASNARQRSAQRARLDIAGSRSRLTRLTRVTAERQLDPEQAARAGSALRADLAAEHLDEALADREPEARAAVAARGRGVGLRERLEQPRHLLFADADAAVAHLEAQPRAGLGRARR